MIKHNQDGVINGVIVALIFTILLLVLAVAFGVWAFGSRQDYKTNVASKVSAAVTTAKQQESATKDKEFAEAIKTPLRTYTGPEAYGSLIIKYPNSWSGYVDDDGQGNALVDGYFYPNIVPSIASQNSTFALRVQVLSQTYAQVAQGFSNLVQNSRNPTTITAYALPQLPKVVGVELTGTLPGSSSKTGVMVVVPLRSETVEIWTEGNQFINDFNTYILPNFSFSP